MVLKTFTILCLMVAGSYSLPKSQVWRDLHGIHFDLFPGSGDSDHLDGGHRWKRQAVKEDSNPNIASPDGVGSGEGGEGNTDTWGDSRSGEGGVTDLNMPLAVVNDSDKGRDEGGSDKGGDSGKGEVLAESRENEASHEGNSGPSTTDCDDLKKKFRDLIRYIKTITSNYDCEDPSTSGTEVTVTEPTTTEGPTHDKLSDGETNQSGTTSENGNNKDTDSDSVGTTEDPSSSQANEPSSDNGSGQTESPMAPTPVTESQPSGVAITQGGGHEDTSGGQAPPTETDSADTSSSSNNKSTDDGTCDVNNGSSRMTKLITEIRNILKVIESSRQNITTTPCSVIVNICGNRQWETK